MDFPPDSLVVNQAHWDERASAHAALPGYAVDRFRVDPEFLSEVVRFDLPRLGDISGLRGVHCNATSARHDLPRPTRGRV